LRLTFLETISKIKSGVLSSDFGWLFIDEKPYSRLGTAAKRLNLFLRRLLTIFQAFFYFVAMRIFPLGETALTIEFGGEISFTINDKVLAVAEYLRQNPFEGLIEIVPAYASLTCFYDVRRARRRRVEEVLRQAAAESSSRVKQIAEPRLIEIPVCYAPEFAPDLEFVAKINNISAAEVVRLHVSCIYRVFMLGFLPGFPYLGETDEKIAAPRKSEPRLRVAAGSVGIAGRQTGVYTLDAPGGWQIIGKTPLAFFDSLPHAPTLLQAGDNARFYEISLSEFERLR
jgi:inhibitor of KinA